MAENKKRFRPTLTEFRALQEELEQVKANLHQTTHELVNTEDDRTDLQRKYDELKRLYNNSAEEVETLNKSNSYLEDRITALNAKIGELTLDVERRDTEIYLLKNRNLWKRIINKL